MSNFRACVPVGRPLARRACLTAVIVGAVLIAGYPAPACADALTSYFTHLQLNTTDLEVDPNRQVNGDFSRDAGAKIDDSVSIHAHDTASPQYEYVMGSHPLASASSTELKSETWIDFFLDEGWGSAKGRAGTFADFYDTIGILWGDVLPDPGYSLAFDWSIDGAMEGRIEGTSDGSHPVFDLRFMDFQYIAAADLFFNWSLDGSPVSNNANLYARDLSRISPHNDDPFKRNATDFVTTGGFTGIPFQGPELTMSYTQAPISNTYYVPVVLSLTMDISYHLQTYVNLGVWNTDYSGGVDGSVATSYGSTAKLTGVRLVDANGNNVAGNWDLTSSSGAYYPILRTPSTNVPEPSLLALCGVALAVAIRRRRGASA